MPRAERDLESIFLYIQADTSQAASRWFAELVKTVDSLAELPQRAPMTREDGSLRHLLFGKKPHVYRILFAIDEALHRVNILHVRHGARSDL